MPVFRSAGRWLPLVTIAYFGLAALPQALSDIELEPFMEAIRKAPRSGQRTDRADRCLQGSRTRLGPGQPMSSLSAFLPSHLERSMKTAGTISGHAPYRSGRQEGGGASANVENIHGPTLLLSARDDQYRPSTHMDRTLRAFHFPHAFEHLRGAPPLEHFSLPGPGRRSYPSVRSQRKSAFEAQPGSMSSARSIAPWPCEGSRLA